MRKLNFENVKTEIPYNFENSELKLIIDKKEKYLKFKVNISIGKYIDMSSNLYAKVKIMKS